MGAVATLSRPDLAVVPGDAVEVTVTVRNSGTVVDELRVEPLGDAAAWAEVVPPSVNVYPGASETVVVRFTPPRLPTTVPGLVPFGLRVASREDPAGSTVEEGVLTVLRFADTGAELLPRTSRARGRRRGTHELAVDNRGNAPLDVRVTPVDPTERVEVGLLAPSLLVGPGQAAFLRLAVRGRTRWWRGPAQTHPFQLLLEPGDDPPLVVEGQLLQESVLPKWVFRALALLLLAAAALVALWFLVLRPGLRDYVGPIARQEGAKAGAQAGTDAAKKAVPPAPAPGGGPSAGPVAGPSTKPSAVPSVAPSGAAVDALGAPTFSRLEATSANQAPAVFFGPQQLFSLTDVVLENPAGDSGDLRLSCGTQTLLRTNLANFRDLDYHFVAPLLCGPSQPVTMTVTCSKPGSGPACTPAVSLAGYVRKPPAATPAPKG